MENERKYVLNIGENKINVSSLKNNTIKVREGLIQPAREEIKCELAPEHTSEPIKDINDIYRISKYLVDHERFRDNMLFIVGINFGLRVSDLRMLRFSHLIAPNLVFRETFPIFEKKTRNTRKRKKNRYITINNAVIEAITLYLENTENVSLSDYMFRSESNRGGNLNQPLSAKSIDRILKGIANDLGLNVKMSTHTLRKTFCYHQMIMSNNDTRKLLLLQKMLNHSSTAQTLDYIGITSEEIYEAYKNFNLGGSQSAEIIHTELLEADVRSEVMLSDLS